KQATEEFEILATAEQIASELIDLLIDHWMSLYIPMEFCLTSLAPRLVANPGRGDDVEKTLLRKLRKHLNDEEWSDLPRMIGERWREEEHERHRQEQFRKQAEALER